MRRSLDELYKILGYSFQNEELLRQALTHRSVRSRNNERLEFLGDSILNFVIAAHVYDRYAESPEGDLSRIRASLVNKDTLAKLGQRLQLGDFLALGAGELKSGGFRRQSILADAVEAVFGAVFLDSNIGRCSKFILKHYEGLLAEPVDVQFLKDPKTQLQEYLQSRQRELPVYELMEASGKPHAQTFKIRCSVPGMSETTTGIEKSRRKAEQQAAQVMLELLRQA
ncbi:MAG TPA: ribonuclease III [Gammaproteobacteria bacterium]|nr:ribonuclease III [Gammaproteobacteria bacterium]